MIYNYNRGAVQEEKAPEEASIGEAGTGMKF